MKLGRSTGLAAVLVVLALGAPAASAAPVTVSLRIEGPTRTVFEGPVTTDVRTFHFSGDVEHACDNGVGAVTRGAVITAAADTTPFTTHGTWYDGLGASFDNIADENVAFDSVTNRYLVEYKNERIASVGACSDPVQNGDRVLFAYATDHDPLLALSGPASASAGDTVALTVTDVSTGAPVSGATVGGATTGSDGKAAITFTQPGGQTFKASKPGMVRSNAVAVAVGAPVVVPDHSAPLARLLGISDKQIFAKGKGPRTIRATAPDASGLAAVKLRLTTRVHGRCFYFSGRRTKFERTRCGRRFFFKVGEQQDVSYLLPKRLGPGRYVLDLAAVDRAGNRTALARGTTRVVFTVR